MVKITFTDAAVDDLRRIGPDAAPKVLKRILLLDAATGYPLGSDLTAFRKVVVERNTWRLTYRITDDKAIQIFEVWAAGEHADAEIHREATARLGSTPGARPELAALTKILERLRRLAGDILVPKAPPREPVPAWLAERLVLTASMPREHVAALDLRQAVDLWTSYICAQR